MQKRIDVMAYELCEEIDHWKSEAKRYKALYEEEVKNYNQMTTERLEDAKKGVANALMFALSVRDNEDGSLSISKENRENLAETFKS